VGYYRSSFRDAGSVVRPWDFVISDSRDGGRTWRAAVVARAAYIGSGSAHQTYIWDLVGVSYDRQGRIVAAWTDQQGRAGGPTSIRFAHQVSR
jgi:hypothetical protein